MSQFNGMDFFMEWNAEEYITLCKALTPNMSLKCTIQMNGADIFPTISEGALLFICRFLFGICQSFFHSVAVLSLVVQTWQPLCGFP